MDWWLVGVVSLPLFTLLGRLEVLLLILLFPVVVINVYVSWLAPLYLGTALLVAILGQLLRFYAALLNNPSCTPIPRIPQ